MKFNLNKNQTKNLFFSVVGVLIILYFVYQIVQMNTNPYKTEIALERPVQSKITTQAFIVRDESYITATNTGGTIVSIAEDGKRVSSGDDVAVVFQDEGSAATYVRINELKKEIDYYKQLNNRVGLGVNAPSSYNKLIDDLGNPASPKYVFKGISRFATSMPQIITGENYNKHQNFHQIGRAHV